MNHKYWLDLCRYFNWMVFFIAYKGWSDIPTVTCLLFKYYVYSTAVTIRFKCRSSVFNLWLIHGKDTLMVVWSPDLSLPFSKWNDVHDNGCTLSFPIPFNYSSSQIFSSFICSSLILLRSFSAESLTFVILMGWTRSANSEKTFLKGCLPGFWDVVNWSTVTNTAYKYCKDTLTQDGWQDIIIRNIKYNIGCLH